MRYQPRQSHPAELHGYRGNTSQSSFLDGEPSSPPWTPPDSDDEMDFPPPEDYVSDGQPQLQISVDSDDRRRMIECMDSMASKDIIEIHKADKKQEDERRKKFLDEMKYSKLTTYTAFKRDNDEEFERMEAYCNFSKHVGSNNRSQHKKIEHPNEGRGNDQIRATAQTPPKSPQFSLTQGQQSRNAFPHQQRIFVPYSPPCISSNSNFISGIHSISDSELENNLDIDSPDETDSDNDISYVGHYADSASRYPDNAMDGEGMSGISRNRSNISSRGVQSVDRDDFHTDRNNCSFSNDDYGATNNLIYSSYCDDISIGTSASSGHRQQITDSQQNNSSAQESTQYTMVENPFHRSYVNRNIAGERERSRHLFGIQQGAAGIPASKLGSGLGFNEQNQGISEVQDLSKGLIYSSIPVAHTHTAAVAVKEKSNGRDREEELYKLMGISYGSARQAAPLASSLSHRSSPLQRSLSSTSTNQIYSPFRNPLCNMRNSPGRGTDLRRGEDHMRSNKLEMNSPKSIPMHSQKEAAGEVESSWELKLKSNELRTGIKQNHSLPRIKLLCRWLSSLHIWERDIEPSTLHTELRSGLFLIRLVQTLDPSAVFSGINIRVHSARPALENLENVLGHVMRTKRVDNNKIPTARQLYDGHQPKVVSFVFELFHAYVETQWGGWRGDRTACMLLWFSDILCQYSRPINFRQSHEGERELKAKTFESPQEHFRSGTDIFCILYHFYGPCVVSDGYKVLPIDPSRIFFSPRSLSDMRSNVSYVFDILEILGLDVFWTVDEWINLDETCFMILQLSKLHDLCRHRQCVLPLADTMKLTPGITSGPFGRPLIVGLCFADTPVPPPPLNYESGSDQSLSEESSSEEDGDQEEDQVEEETQRTCGLHDEVYHLFSFREHEKLTKLNLSAGNRDGDSERIQIKDSAHFHNQNDPLVYTNTLDYRAKRMEGESKRNNASGVEDMESVHDESQISENSEDDYISQDRVAVNNKREKRKSSPTLGSSLGLDAGNLRMMRDSSSGSGIFFCSNESTLLNDTTSAPCNNNSTPLGREAGRMQALLFASQCPKGLLSSVCCLDLRKAIAAGNTLQRAREAKKAENIVPCDLSPSSSHVASKSQKLKSSALLKLNSRTRQYTECSPSDSAGRDVRRESDSGKVERVLRGGKSTERLELVEESHTILSENSCTPNRDSEDAHLLSTNDDKSLPQSVHVIPSAPVPRSVGTKTSLPSTSINIVKNHPSNVRDILHHPSPSTLHVKLKDNDSDCHHSDYQYNRQPDSKRRSCPQSDLETKGVKSSSSSDHRLTSSQSSVPRYASSSAPLSVSKEENSKRKPSVPLQPHTTKSLDPFLSQSLPNTQTPSSSRIPFNSIPSHLVHRDLTPGVTQTDEKQPTQCTGHVHIKNIGTDGGRSLAVASRTEHISPRLIGKLPTSSSRNSVPNIPREGVEGMGSVLSPMGTDMRVTSAIVTEKRNQNDSDKMQKNDTYDRRTQLAETSRDIRVSERARMQFEDGRRRMHYLYAKMGVK